MSNFYLDTYLAKKGVGGRCVGIMSVGCVLSARTVHVGGVRYQGRRYYVGSYTTHSLK